MFRFGLYASVFVINFLLCFWDAPASKKAELQDLLEEAQTLFGDLEGGLTVTSKDQVSSEQIMRALPDAFHDGDIDLDDVTLFSLP